MSTSGNTYSEYSDDNRLSIYDNLVDGVVIYGWSVDENLTTIDFNLGTTVSLNDEFFSKFIGKQDINGRTLTLYAVLSSTYEIVYDLNTEENIIIGSTTDITGINSTTSGQKGIDESVELVFSDYYGNTWEIASLNYLEANARYAYFLGWSFDENAEVPDYYIGDRVTETFSGVVTLYAVWGYYTNPFYFSYEDATGGVSISGLSSLGEDNIDTDIVMPRHTLVETQGTLLFGENIVGIISNAQEITQIESIDLTYMTSLTSIGELAFSNYSNLVNVLSIPQDILIGNGAFSGRNIEAIEFIESDEVNYFVDRNNNVYSYSFNYSFLYIYL